MQQRTGETVPADDGLDLKAQFIVPYVQWGMKNPSTLFLRVGDKVTIDVKEEIEEGLRLSGADVARAEVARWQLWRRFQEFLEKYEYFILPTTQLPPFDVTTPYPTEIAGVKFNNYIDWMKSCWYISATGNPAASVPGGFTQEGLPVGALRLEPRHVGGG